MTGVNNFFKEYQVACAANRELEIRRALATAVCEAGNKVVRALGNSAYQHEKNMALYELERTLEAWRSGEEGGEG